MINESHVGPARFKLWRLDETIWDRNFDGRRDKKLMKAITGPSVMHAVRLSPIVPLCPVMRYFKKKRSRFDLFCYVCPVMISFPIFTLTIFKPCYDHHKSPQWRVGLRGRRRFSHSEPQGLSFTTGRASGYAIAIHYEPCIG